MPHLFSYAEGEDGTWISFSFAHLLLEQRIFYVESFSMPMCSHPWVGTGPVTATARKSRQETLAAVDSHRTGISRAELIQ